MRVRGQEYSGNVVVGGKLLVGSFAKMESLTFTPLADLKDSDFVGDEESEYDVQHHGWEVKWTIHQEDDSAIKLYLQLVAALKSGAPLPQMNFVGITTYRDPSIPTSTKVAQNLRFKLDDEANSGRKEYVKNSFTGRCKIVRVL